jgi:hypothetical protein
MHRVVHALALGWLALLIAGGSGSTGEPDRDEVRTSRADAVIQAHRRLIYGKVHAAPVSQL